jgi:hypothetical protein
MRAAAIIIAMLLTSPALADESVAECYISVDQKELLTGQCLFKKEADLLVFKPFTVETPFIVGVFLPQLTAAVIWRDGSEEGFDAKPLGAVTALDACWVNDRVRICAWKQELQSPLDAPVYGTKPPGSLPFGPGTNTPNMLLEEHPQQPEAPA